jgi:hypothetical protein
MTGEARLGREKGREKFDERQGGRLGSRQGRARQGLGLGVCIAYSIVG